jgi:hypothetical protein
MCFVSRFLKVEYIMLTWIIQFSIISIIFIFLVHHILLFFKSTLTVPKIKDLVNSPNQKYQNIYDTLLHNSNSFTNIDLLPSNDTSLINSSLNNEYVDVERNNMKDELKSFLKTQLNNTLDDSNVMGMNSSSNHFSNF